MALKKEIRQDDGVVTSYHRILFIQSTVNSHTSIAVLSYIDEQGRKQDTINKPAYQVAVTYETDYVQNMTVRMAYEYLKTLDKFQGAEDILDDMDDSISGEEFLAMVEEVM